MFFLYIMTFTRSEIVPFFPGQLFNNHTAALFSFDVKPAFLKSTHTQLLFLSKWLFFNSTGEIKFSAKRFFCWGFILNSPFLQLRPYQISGRLLGNLRSETKTTG